MNEEKTIAVAGRVQNRRRMRGVARLERLSLISHESCLDPQRARVTEEAADDERRHHRLSQCQAPLMDA